MHEVLGGRYIRTTGRAFQGVAHCEQTLPCDTTGISFEEAEWVDRADIPWYQRDHLTFQETVHQVTTTQCTDEESPTVLNPPDEDAGFIP